MEPTKTTRSSCGWVFVVLLLTSSRSLTLAQVRYTACNPFDGEWFPSFDVHDPLCPANTALHGFLVQARNCGGFTNNLGRLQYECVGSLPGGLNAATELTTACYQTATILRGQGIDRWEDFNIDCPNQQVLTRWDMTDSGCSARNHRFRYWCATLGDSSSNLSCTTYSTTCQVAQGERLEYLDRHDFFCPNSQPWLNRLEMVGPASCGSDERRMLYRCCDAVTPAPTPSPTLPPTLDDTAGGGGGGGAGGDPHFTTWTGQHFDFHGHCDLVLFKNDDFHGGKGIAVHIRSAPFQTVFSYISNLAIKIGNDVLELASPGKYYVNGNAGQHPLDDVFAGYRVTFHRGKTGKRVYTIHLGPDTFITVREQKGWFRVRVEGARKEDFASSYGLMGSFDRGTWYGRDRETVFD